MHIKQIIILAGGLATRLYPITEKIPKSMIQVNGRPFLEHQIDLCIKNRVSKIVLCAGHLWEQIWDYFGDGSRFGVKIIYSVEKERLDTGGALKNALPLLDEEFFVLYGDSYLTADWQAIAGFFKKSGAQGLMAVYRNDGTLGVPSQITVRNICVIEFTKKDFKPEMEFIEYGLNIFSRSVIGRISKKSFPLGRYFELLIEEKQLVSYEVTERYYEIGCPVGLENFKLHLV